MPELLQRIEQSALEPVALNRVFDLVLAICRRSAYLVLLAQHPQALDRMLDLFQNSEWIAAKVIRFPALLDELIDPALGRQIPDCEELERSIDRILDASQGAEAVLEGLNYLKLATELRVAVAQLKGSLGADAVQRALSDLAAALIRGVLEVAGREIVLRHGGFVADRAQANGQGLMGIVGYGTLGAAELGYESDLDIVFLFSPVDGLSGGNRPLPPDRYFARLAQRVLSFLTVMTPSGRLYEVDTRLRPNGRAGSLVSNTRAFRDYQLNQAWTWELQALTRARFIAGNPDVAVEFNRIRQDALCRNRKTSKLAAELLAMRDKMDAEHIDSAHIDSATSPKHRRGGLIDIEFVAQLGVLTTARAYPRVLQAHGTLDQLRELQAIGWLSEADAAVLESTLLALRERRLMASLIEAGSSAGLETAAAANVFNRIVCRDS
jgi:glutamate-ammonia-ligase adenylyltransferase